MKATMRLSSLAEYLDISQDEITALVATGQLPEPVQLGKYSVWLRTSVDQCVERLGTMPAHRKKLYEQAAQT